MEMGAAGDPPGARGDPPAGTYLIPHRVSPIPSPPSSQLAVPVSQQPLMILQQLPGPGAVLAPPARPPPVRGDLIELMMIQNSQMHQVVMNGLAVSALTSFGFGPSAATAQALAMPWQTEEEEEEEEEAVVFHHHYIPYPGPVFIPERDRGPVAVRYLGSLAEDEARAVPPPPPPSATGTVGPSVPPAAGKDTFSPCPSARNIFPGFDPPRKVEEVATDAFWVLEDVPCLCYLPNPTLW
ncbi:proline-rich protein 29-like [Empidonax traillii]|uniref:proline-rich protein 29-like n=1 Tax=Empidonax traillii TaxID=164674 RepID=UPI000FFCE559|nr:proline-rich protein 29-like [Empidonax traillii]